MKKSFMILIFIFILSILSAPLVLAELTVSSVNTITLGNKRGIMANIAFDSSYAYGGEALSGVSFGMSAIDRVIVEAKEGYTFEYDHTNNKLKVYTKAPPIVYEEKHSADTAGQFTLDYPAAFIVSVVRSGGTAYPVIYSGTTTLGMNTSCLPNGIDDGTRTGVSAYTPSVIYNVTYATQAWQDLYKLYVENELLTGAGITRYTISGNSIFACQSVKYGGAVSGVTPIDYADTTAAGEIKIDFGDYVALGNSGATQAVCLIATGTQAVYMTYLKSPPANSWLESHYVRDEDATSGTSIMSLDKPLLLWLNSGYGVSNGDPSWQIVLQDQPSFFNYVKTSASPNSGVSEMYTAWGFRGPAAAGAAPSAAQVWGVYDSTNMSMTHATYLFGHPWEIPNLKPLEVVNGANLSDLTGVKVLVIGW
uniref:Uncharacterized protein n=1 Tax=viral metagenome TaxID=1070528 RepID=A0A6H1ZMH9_9ZZZZ